MYYLFNDDISLETINELVDKLQSCDKEEEIQLYFGTNGGETTAMSFFISYLNSIKDRVTVTLTDRVWSAGTDLLLDFKGRLKINYDEIDSFLFHVADRRMYLQSQNRDIQSTKEIKKQDKEINLKWAEKIKNKNLLTKKQLKDFINGKDVLVYKKQFKNWKL